MSLKPEYFCSYCKYSEPIENSTLKTCTACYGVKYCDKICQEKHFTQHKNECKKDFTKKFHEIIGSISCCFKEDTKVYCLNGCFQFVLGQHYYKIAEKYQSYFAYQRAAEVFETILELKLEEQDLYMYPYEYLCFVYLNLGHYEKAEKLAKLYWVKNSVNIDSSPIVVALKLASLLKKLGKNSYNLYNFIR